MYAFLNAVIGLQFGDDLFEILQLEVFAEYRKIELVDSILVVFRIVGFYFNDSFRNVEDEPGFFLDAFAENSENFRENLDQGYREFLTESVGTETIISSDPAFEVLQHPPLEHIDQALSQRPAAI